MSKILKHIICYSIFLCSHITSAETYQAFLKEPLQIKISKSGLNRISNPPYSIIQVTGDDSKFRIKYDEDGANIYFMPLSKVGENIEISIKNNAGFVQDLELLVSNIRGKSIIIDGKTSMVTEHIEKSDVARMLRAMKDDVDDKFYVQRIKKKLSPIGILNVEQGKIYKYKNLVGGVFEIRNLTKALVTFDVSIFVKGFDNVKSSYPIISNIEPRQAITVLVVQKVAEK